MYNEQVWVINNSGELAEVVPYEHSEWGHGYMVRTYETRKYYIFFYIRTFESIATYLGEL